jgi:hypothetical protein
VLVVVAARAAAGQVAEPGLRSLVEAAAAGLREEQGPHQRAQPAVARVVVAAEAVVLIMAQQVTLVMAAPVTVS